MNPIVEQNRKILVQKATKIFDAMLAQCSASLGDVHAAEQAALQAIEALRPEIVTSCMAGCLASADRHYCCPQCGMPLSHWSTRERQIVCMAGGGRFDAPRYRCRACRKDFYPWQMANGLDDGQYTLGAREEIAREAAEAHSYEKASEHLQKRGLCVSASEVDRIVQEVGRWRKQEEQVVRACSCKGINMSLPLHNYSTLAGIAPVDAVAVISVDGGMIRSTTPGPGGLEWFEARSGIIRFQTEKQTLLSVCSAAVREADEVFETLRSQWQQVPKAWRIGKDAPRLVFIADGASWIWMRARWYFPHAIFILDLYHGAQHVASAARACWGQDSKHGRLWADNAMTWLQEPGASKIILQALIDVLRSGRACNPKQLRTEIGYLWAHRHRMDYARYKAQGLPIGSGAIESNIKQTSKRRLVQAGMMWTKSHADLMLHVRAACLSQSLALTIERERKIRRNRITPFYTQPDRLSLAI